MSESKHRIRVVPVRGGFAPQVRRHRSWVFVCLHSHRSKDAAQRCGEKLNSKPATEEPTP